MKLRDPHWLACRRGQQGRNDYLSAPHTFTLEVGTSGKLLNSILVKIITRMKLLFSNYLRDYSYCFQGFSERISITVTDSFFVQNAVTGIIPLRNSQDFSAITATKGICAYWNPRRFRRQKPKGDGQNTTISGIWRHVTTFYPRAQNQYMKEKHLGEQLLEKMHAWPAFALARKQAKMFENFSIYTYIHTRTL